MLKKILVRRGNKADLPKLDVGEPALAVDTEEVFVGSNSGNKQLANKTDVDNVNSKIEQAQVGADGTNHSSLKARLDSENQSVTSQLADTAEKFTNKTFSMQASEIELIAHRGGADIAPENTTIAFSHALAMGFDSIECDVHITSDGYPVVCHDDTIDRTSNGTGAIVDMTLEQLQEYDFSKGYTQFPGLSIPLFDDYLSIAKQGSKFIYPEIKGYRNTSDIQIIVNKVIQAGLEDKCIMQSFHYGDFEFVRQLSKKITLGYLVSDINTFNSLIQTCKEDGNALILCAQNVLTANPQACLTAFGEGVDVVSWTGTNQMEIENLKALGIRRFLVNNLFEVKN